MTWLPDWLRSSYRQSRFAPHKYQCIKMEGWRFRLAGRVARALICSPESRGGAAAGLVRIEQ
jgi:hypothetical protein